MTVEFAHAVRENVPLLIGLAGSSGSGKTFSGFELAKGLAGGNRFAVIDTEARRALHYANEFEFDHAELRPPFRPQAYQEAIVAADEAGYPVIMVDSVSHEHAGEGGLLDWHDEELDRMAGTDWKKRDVMNMAAWVKPKREHRKFMSRLLQVHAHLILCFRAEQKVDMVKNPQTGKIEIVPKRLLSGHVDWIPICEKNTLYELTLSLLLTADAPGVPKPVKLEEQHRAIVPTDQQLSAEVGVALAEWARGAAAPLGESEAVEQRATRGNSGSPSGEVATMEERQSIVQRAEELGLSAEQGRAVLQRVAGQSSTVDLPAAKVSEVLAELEREAQGTLV